MEGESNGNSGYRLVAMLILALTSSVSIAVGILIAVRRRQSESLKTDVDAQAPYPAQPAVSTSMETGTPHHFSEDLLVPGITSTGPDIVRQDDQDGRSPEGV